jgi:hypothetical protein
MPEVYDNVEDIDQISSILEYRKTIIRGDHSLGSNRVRIDRIGFWYELSEMGVISMNQ